MGKSLNKIEKILCINQYRLNPAADRNGTSRQGEINVVYAQLEKVLGKPEESDGNKVSGEWVLEDEHGNVFTIYDYKSTNLYDESYPSVEEFRACKSKQHFSVGGRMGTGTETLFIPWLLKKILAGERIE